MSYLRTKSYDRQRSMERGFTPTNVLFSCPAKQHARTESTKTKLLKPSDAYKLMVKHVKQSSVSIHFYCMETGIYIKPIGDDAAEGLELRLKYSDVHHVYVSTHNTQLIMLCLPDVIVKEQDMYETYECKSESDAREIIDIIVKHQSEPSVETEELPRPNTAPLAYYDYPPDAEYDRDYGTRSSQPATQWIAPGRRAMYSLGNESTYHAYSTTQMHSAGRAPEYGYPLREECIYLTQTSDGVTRSERGPIYIYSCRVGNEVQSYTGEDLESGTNSPIYR